MASLIFLWIVYFLWKIMLTVKENNPFDQMSPDRIRKMAYAVFFLLPVEILSKILIKGIQKIFSTLNFVDMLRGSLFELVFLGFVLLVIAKVFELGVEPLRDQKLTI